MQVLTILHITRAGLTMCVKLNIASPKYANIQVSENERRSITTVKCVVNLRQLEIEILG